MRWNALFCARGSREWGEGCKGEGGDGMSKGWGRWVRGTWLAWYALMFCVCGRPLCGACGVGMVALVWILGCFNACGVVVA